MQYLYALALRLSGNRTAAEDLVQDGLLHAFRGFPGLRNRDSTRVWLTRVLIRCFHDRLRIQARPADRAISIDNEETFDLFDKVTEEDPFPYSDRVHLDFLDLFDDLKLIEVLQGLSPSCRTALILAYVYGFKTREIAEMTRKPVGTVLAWLFRGRKQLERELWDYASRTGLIAQEEAKV